MEIAVAFISRLRSIEPWVCLLRSCSLEDSSRYQAAGSSLRSYVEHCLLPSHQSGMALLQTHGRAAALVLVPETDTVYQAHRLVRPGTPGYPPRP